MGSTWIASTDQRKLRPVTKSDFHSLTHFVLNATGDWELNRVEKDDSIRQHLVRFIAERGTTHVAGKTLIPDTTVRCVARSLQAATTHDTKRDSQSDH